MNKEIIKLRKTYYGVLCHHFSRVSDGKEIPIFELEQSEGCCCSDGGFVLYDTKKAAKNSWEGKKEDSRIVKFTTEVVK